MSHRWNVSIAVGLLAAAACSTERGFDGNAEEGALTANEATGEESDAGGAESGMDKLDLGGGEGPSEGPNEGGPLDPCQQAVASNSNQGCEFWAIDAPNIWDGIQLGEPAPEDQQFAVVVANAGEDTMALVEVFVGADQAPVDTAIVGPGQLHTFELAPMNIEPRANSMGTAYRIESDVPITAYEFQPLDNSVEVFSNDASLLFPVHVLQTDYTAITGDAIQIWTGMGPDNSGAFVSVIADEDGTEVQLFPSATLYPGPTSVVLNRGQVQTWISQAMSTGMSGDGNLSGSRILSDKPVAVISGNVSTVEPYPGDCCADHMEHQMLPLTAWGSSYVGLPPASPFGAELRNPAIYRVTGAYDGTMLSYSPAPPPGAPTVINAGQTVRFQTDQAFVLETEDPDTPFGVAEFLLSNQSLPSDGEPGDPAMWVLPAIDQFQERYVFLVPEGYGSNYVGVVRPQGAAVSLDGVAVDASFSPAGMYGPTSYEFAALPLSAGSHTLEADAPVGIYSYGYAPDVSYAYPGGSGVAVIAEPPPPPQP